ncbi:MAG: segregation and condensation protein A [Candidatus Komeilibacteria bacterium]
MYEIKLEKFEGPLDLLLQLIEGQKLPITEVSLTQVTDQYVEYIHTATAINPEEIADFLMVAAKLLYAKSKEILPSAIWEEEEDGIDLAEQLKIYKEYHDASKLIDKMARKEIFTYSRIAPITKKAEEGFYPPHKLTKSLMKELFSTAIKKLEPVIYIPKTIIEKTITITEKIKEIKLAIKEAVSMDFKKLLSKGGKTDTIMSFLAMLELIKQRDIEVDQNSLFDTITIKKTESLN